MSENFTKTVVDTVTPAFTDPFQVILTTPTPEHIDRSSPEARNRVPITCHISQHGAEDSLGCLIYSIPDARRKQIYQTILNNSEEELLDATKRLSRLITSKYNVSSYVSISGNVAIDDSIVYIKRVIELIEAQMQ
ncbi:unnamed protein product [Kuraishia capsulata CBS 1993]|uniref:Proteasome assembly chaperone 3 n=1 Tax=Kuraishia capsulata CBS 1993 TaxID=1382522 RepID=W6MIL6_9ASCO|nr:uncharacterized protein KUCA_T00001733001 [Kuraishia capsulata CBS 1993]CDK25763.1 unnamed protein product [Kuraishia capsulata CBS 1993]